MLLCVADYDGHFVRVNKHFTDVLGYSIEELEGKYFLDLVHPEDVVRTLNFIKDERINTRNNIIEIFFFTMVLLIHFDSIK